MSYDPGPTAAVASFVLSFMMRSSLLLNAASPPSVRSITALGSYVPTPGVTVLAPIESRFVFDANAEPCFGPS